VAAVDSLLALVLSQRARGLRIVSNDVPELETADGVQLLSMPEVGAEMVASFVEHVLQPEDRARLAQGTSVEALYRSGDGTCFDVEAHFERGLHRLVLRLPAEEGAETPEPVESPSPPSTPSESSGLTLLLLREAAAGASDIVLSEGSPVWLRRRGELSVLPSARVAQAELREWIAGALGSEAERILEEEGSADVALCLGDEGRRFRVNVFKQQRGLAAAVRPIRGDPPRLAELGLPDDFSSLSRFRSGLVLMTGPTGSGKSTTLVALIEELHRARGPGRHVITLEDPIEYAYGPGRCLIHQREVGEHMPDFATGLRAALREDPDVILVGEMRDTATFAAALTAAETGHLVLSTLHTGSAAMAIDRIIDAFPAHRQSQVAFQLASSLRAVVTQHLLPRSSGRGRVPVVEKLVVTAAVANLIREGRAHQLPSLIQTGREAGMLPLELSLAERVRAGDVDLEVARAAANDPRSLDHLLSS